MGRCRRLFIGLAIRLAAVFGVLAAVILAVLLVVPHRWEPYNKHPDLSDKWIPSYMDYVEHLLPYSIEQIVEYSDVVLTGTVVRDDFSKSGNVFAEVRVERILAGNPPPEETIQLANRNSRVNDPPLQAGQRVLLCLKEWRDGYVCTNSSAGIFFLDENDRLTSMSPFTVCARYDGLSLRSFEGDLWESWYYPVIGGSEEEWEARDAACPPSFWDKRRKEWSELIDGKDPHYEFEVIRDYFRQLELKELEAEEDKES